MKIRDIMTPDPTTGREDQTIRAAALTLLEHRVASLPIVDDRGRLKGLLTEGDLFTRRHALPFSDVAEARLFGETVSSPGSLERVYREHRDDPVSAFMTRDLVTLRPDDDVTQAALRMMERGIKHLPVVDGDRRLVGEARWAAEGGTR